MYNDKWISDPLAFYNTIWCYKDRISEISEYEKKMNRESIT